MEKKTAEQTDIEWIKGSLTRIEEGSLPRIEDRLSSLEAFKWKTVGSLVVVVFILESIFHGK